MEGPRGRGVGQGGSLALGLEMIQCKSLAQRPESGQQRLGHIMLSQASSKRADPHNTMCAGVNEGHRTKG